MPYNIENSFGIEATCSMVGTSKFAWAFAIYLYFVSLEFLVLHSRFFVLFFGCYSVQYECCIRERRKEEASNPFINLDFILLPSCVSARTPNMYLYTHIKIYLYSITFIHFFGVFLRLKFFNLSVKCKL